MDYSALNAATRRQESLRTENCLGQRFLSAGISDKHITINGIPGNALGAYLNGAEIILHGNAQDAVGDTMNEGRIIIHGNVGDTAGYAMRGSKIFVKGNADYRTGIRSDCQDIRSCHQAAAEDLDELRPVLEEYCGCFGLDFRILFHAPFTVVIPDSANPCKQMYVAN